MMVTIYYKGLSQNSDNLLPPVAGNGTHPDPRLQCSFVLYLWTSRRLLNSHSLAFDEIQGHTNSNTAQRFQETYLPTCWVFAVFTSMPGGQSHSASELTKRQLAVVVHLRWWR